MTLMLLRVAEVINIIVEDGTGKAVIRFRAALDNKQLHMPASNLRPEFIY
jgi:hypothetical protein